MSRLLLIDGDSMVYSAGYSAQQRGLRAVGFGKDEQLCHEFFEGVGKKSREDALAWIDGMSLEDATIEEDVVPGLLKEAHERADSLIADIIRECKCDSHEIFISGSTNYRDMIAKVRPYKGNRDHNARPVHYGAIRSHLVAKYPTTVVEGIEADDEISIRAWQMCREYNREGFVVASIDKDLDQIPGWHYNYQKGVSYSVFKGDAEYCFWRQAITGDATDNIPGCPRVGPRKAEAFMAEHFDYNSTTEQLELLWSNIVQLYVDQGSTEEAAIETARLVYLQRVRHELWNPPGQPAGELSELIQEKDVAA